MAALPRLRARITRRVVLVAAAGGALLLVAALLLLVGSGSTASAPAAAPSPAAAASAPEQPALKPRPKVVEAIAPGQDSSSAPDAGAGSTADPGDAPSPGAASDAEIQREIDGLGRAGGGADAAILRPDGQAIAPSEAPTQVKLIVEAGNEISKYPYKWGGGHGRWLDNGYDCSGSVSYALAAGGLLGGPLTSGGLARWGSKGRGKWITVYANGGHVYMVVAGLRFDTSGRTSRLGSRWQLAQRSGGSYSVRHPPGL